MVKERELTRKQHGFSLIELLIVVSIILVLAAILIPNMLRSRIAANEASAVRSLRAINDAEVTYNISYNTYTCSLPSLGPPIPSGSQVSSLGAGIIDATLAAGTKSGYTFTAGPDCPTGSNIVTYQWVADPIAQGTSGSREFCTDQTYSIRVDPNTGNCLSIGSPIS